MTITGAVFLLALVAGTYSGPIDVLTYDDPSSCARTCSGSNKFRYLPGRTYEFGYEAATTMQGSHELKSALTIRATVELHVLSQCEVVLQLRDVSLLEHDPANPSQKIQSPRMYQFKNALEEFPLRVGFDDGNVIDICPSEGEPIWSLNIKRGLLSSLQNAMESLEKDQIVKEADINGECSTEYKVEASNWYAGSTIHKTKNLLACTSRLGHQSSAAHALPWAESKSQSLPLLQSHHRCTQVVSHAGRLTLSECQETHIFRPFSRDTKSAITTTRQSLKFQSEKHGTNAKRHYIGRRTTLHFEHTPGTGASDQSGSGAASEKLAEICQVAKDDIRPEVPGLFAELVQKLRNLDIRSLQELHRDVKGQIICRGNAIRGSEFFLDAVAIAGTSASVRLIQELLTSSEVEGVKAEFWVLSLAFIANPTKETLAAVKPLLDHKPNGRVKMSVSAMVTSYCRANPDCGSVDEVQAIMEALAKPIRDSDCEIRRGNKEQLLTSLRALENMGHAERSVPILNRCLMNKALPMELRVAAAQAFRKMACQADVNDVMAVFRNVEEDSELRINAYLSVMECPNDYLLEQIKSTLESEKVNQVGSFVWTHLTNLMETSDPNKQKIREIVEDIDLKKEFNLDNRKFSRNYEKSYFFEKLNTGAKAESNIIWSSKSFLPRSAMLNLTVDLFGERINLLEVGGRMEGLEYLMEAYLGPEGYLSGKTRGPSTTPRNSALRMEKLNRIDQTYAKSAEKLQGSMYLRMFGTELGFASLDKFREMGRDFDLGKFISKLSRKQELQVTKSVILFDRTMVVPTSSGLPLDLTINATASVDLSMSGKVDFRSFTHKPRSFDIIGKIQPSAAIQVASTISVDAFVARAGLRIVSTLHTSTALQGKAQLSQGQVVNIEMDMLKDKMEIIDLRTQFFSLHHERQREQIIASANQRTRKFCSGQRLTEITGLELCAELKHEIASPNALYYAMSSSPVSMGLALHKRDTFDAYKFTAKYDASTAAKTARISFDTPGSRISREWAADVTVNPAENGIEVNLISPWKRAGMKGSYKYTDSVKRIEGSVSVDSHDKLGILAELQIDTRGQVVQYRPVIELRIPGRPVMKLSGKARNEDGQNMDVDINLENMFKAPIRLKSSLANSAQQKSAMAKIILDGKKEYAIEASYAKRSSDRSVVHKPSFNIRTPEGEIASFDGSIEHKPGKRSTINLKLDKLTKKPFILKGDIRRSSNPRRNRNVIDIQIKSPYLTTSLDTTFDHRPKKGITSLRMDLSYDIRRVTKDNLKFNGKLRDMSSSRMASYDVSANMETTRHPEYNFKLDSDFKLNRALLQSSLDLHYGHDFKDEQKRIFFTETVSYVSNQKSREIDYNMKVRHLKQDINVIVKGTHKHTANEFTTTTLIRYEPKKDVSLNLHLKDDSRDLKKWSGYLTLSYPGQSLRVTSDMTQQNRKECVFSIDGQLGGKKANMKSILRLPSTTSAEIESNVKIARMDPVTVQAAVDVNPRNAKLSIRASQSGQSVSVKTYSQLENEMYTAAVDVSYPSRHVVADLSTSWKNPFKGRVDVKWDADKDETARVMADGSFEQHGRGYVMSTLLLKIPSREIKMNLKHSGSDKYISHFDLEWEPRQKINVDTSFQYRNNWYYHQLDATLDLTSPFRALRALEAKLDQIFDRSKFSTALAMTHNRKDSIQTNFIIKRPINWDHIETSLSISTPFSGYDTINAKIDHSIDNALLTSIVASSGKHNINFRATGTNRGTSYKRDLAGQIDLKTSSSYIGKMQLKGSHEDDGRKYDSSVSANLGRLGDFGATIDVTHDKHDNEIQNGGKLKISTPFSGYETIDYSWRHKHSSRSVDSSATSRWGMKRINFDIKGNFDWSSYLNVLNGEAKLSTSFNNLRELAVSIDHTHRAGTIQSIVSVIQDRSKKAGYSVNAKYTNFDVDSDLIVTIPGMDQIISKLKTKINNSPRTAHLELQWAPEKKIAIESRLHYDLPRFVDGNVRFITPFAGYDHLLLIANHGKQRGEWVSNARFEYAPRKAIALTCKFSEASPTNVRLELTSPCPHMRRAYLSTHYSGDIRNKADARLEFDLQPAVGEIVATASIESGREITVKARVETPFVNYRYAQAKFVREPGQSEIEIEYQPRQVINLNSQYNFGDRRNMNAGITVTTPFRNLEFAKADFSHRGDASQFRSTGSWEYPRSKKTAGRIEFRNNDAILGSAVLTSSYVGYESVKLLFKHEGSLKNFSTNAELDLVPYDKVQADLAFSLTESRKGPVMDLNVDVKIPLIEDISFKIDHEGDIKEFKSEISGKYGPHNTATAELQFSSEQDLEAEALINVASELTRFRLASAAWNFKGNRSDFSTDLKGKFQDMKIDTVATLSLLDGVDGKVIISGNLPNLEDITFTIKHQGGARRFISQTALDYAPGKKIEGEVRFSNRRGPGFKLSTALRTPFENAEDITSIISIQEGPDSLNGKLDVRYAPRKSILGTFDYTIKGWTNFNVSAALKTPCTYIKDVSVAVGIDGSVDSMKGKVDVQYAPKKQIQTNFDFVKRSWPVFQFNAGIKSPLNSLEDISTQIGIEGTPANLNGLWKLNYTPNKDITAKFNFDQRSSTAFQLAASLVSPCPYARALSATINFDRRADATEGNVDIKYAPYKKITGKFDFSHGRWPEFQMNAALQSPCPHLQDVSYHISLDGSTDNLKGKARVQYAPAKQIEGDVTFSKQRGLNFDITAALRTPFVGAEEITSTFAINDQSNQLKSKASVEYGRNQKIAVNINLARRDATNFELEGGLTTPFQGIEDISSKVTLSGDIRNMDGNIRVQYAPYKLIESEFTLTILQWPNAKITTALRTPFKGFEDLSASADIGGTPRNLNGKVGVKYAPYKQIDCELNIAIQNIFDFETSASMKTPFEGVEDMSAAVSVDNSIAKASLTYAPGKKIEIDASLNTDDDIGASLQIKSPFYGYEDLSSAVHIQKGYMQYAGNGHIQYAYRKRLSFSGDVDYSNDVSGKLRIDTPFQGWEQMSAGVALNGEITNFNGKGHIEYAPGERIEVSSSLDLKGRGKSWNVRLATPFRKWETVDTTVSFNGSPTNFKAALDINSAVLDTVRSKVIFNYVSVNDIDGSVVFTSGIPNAENLKIVFSNKGTDTGYDTHSEVSWAPHKSITLEHNYSREQGWYGIRKFTQGLKIRTPFEILRYLDSSLEYGKSSTGRTAKIVTGYNGSPLLDVDVELTDGSARILDVIVKNPRPMRYKLTGTWEDDEISGDAQLNWDTRDSESTLQVTGKYQNQEEISFSVLRPDHAIKGAANIKKTYYGVASDGEMTINGKKFSYELAVKDQSRRYNKAYDGTLKLSLPARTVEIRGSHSSDLSVMSDDATIMWDATRDQSMTASFRSTIRSLSNQKKADITVRLPGMQQDMTMKGDITFNQGNTLMDGKAEIVYSSDDRKTVTAIARVAKEGYDNNNYTVHVALTHPYTDTDVTVAAHAGNGDERRAAGVRVQYLTALRKRQSIALQAEIDKIKKTLNLELASPVKNIRIQGGVQSQAGPARLYMHQTVDGKRMNTELTFDADKRTMALKMNYDLDDPRKEMHVTIACPDDRSCSAELWRRSHGQRVTDALIALHLNTSKILHTRIHWRPAVWNEIADATSQRMQAYPNSLNAVMGEIQTSVSRELRYKMAAVRRAMDEDAASIMRTIDEQIQVLSDEWEGAKNWYSYAYIRNDYHLRDIAENYHKVTAKLASLSSQASQHVLCVLHSAKQAVAFDIGLMENWEKSRNSVKDVYAAAIVKFEDAKVAMNQKTQAILESVIQKAEPLTEKFQQMYSRMLEYVSERSGNLKHSAADMTSAVLNHPRVLQLGEKMRQIAHSFPETSLPQLPELPDMKRVMKLKHAVLQYVRIANRGAAKAVAKMADQYTSMIYNAHESMNNKIAAISSHPHMDYAKNMAKHILIQGMDVVRSAQIDQAVRAVVMAGVDYGVRMAKDEIADFKSNFVTFTNSLLIAFDPKQGEIQFEIYLPLVVESLRVTPDLAKYVRQSKALIRQYLHVLNYNLYDVYYRYKPSSLNPRDWIPPFKAHAMQSGPQHFVTFDGRHFDFSGLCSYILARDFVDGNFSVILNYGGDRRDIQKKSLLVFLGDRSIEIFPDYRVEVDGVGTDLPIDLEGTQISREAASIVVRSSKGVDVSCDLANDIYMVSISGWYFGKTAGLLGTYDNEPANDFISPHNRLNEDVGKFANSWEVGRNCRISRNFAVTSMSMKGSSTYEKCAALFQQSSSPFRACFKQVDPVAYQSKCAQEQISIDNNDKVMCETASLYRMACQHMGVSLAQPAACVRCHVNNANIQMGNSVEISSDAHTSSADVIFVLEHRDCNKAVIKELPTLVSTLERELKNKGMENNRYGLVGFGGKGISDVPHTHTMAGQVLNEPRQFIQALDAMTSPAEGSNRDVMQAIQYAAAFTFRPGSSKTLVLLSCSPCDGPSVVSQAALRTELIDKDIKLHVLREQAFGVADNRSPKQRIFGVDLNGAFTNSQSAKHDLIGNQELLRSLSMPQDSCVSLASAVDGSVFNARGLVSGDSRLRKSFMTVFSRRLSMTAKPQACQVCTCAPDSDGVGHSVCKPCHNQTSSSWSAYLPSWMQNKISTPAVKQLTDFDSQLNSYISDGSHMFS